MFADKEHKGKRPEGDPIVTDAVADEADETETAPASDEVEPVLVEEPEVGMLAEPPLSAIKRLEDQLADAQDRHLRLAAEFDNFRKRVARERIELTDRAQAALVTRLLDVLDDLDRVASADLGGMTAEAVHQAVQLVDRKFRKELEAAGLERIDPVGGPFDPSVHEAVAMAPTDDPALDHTVSATFQAGFLYKGTLVRPARVQVYSAPGQS